MDSEQAKIAYRTDYGMMIHGKIEDVLQHPPLQDLEGKIDLIFTSPPFPLTKKKSYGNLEAIQYVEWLADLGKRFEQLLAPTGSLVVEIGNAWEPGNPVMQTWPLEALLSILESTNLYLCQTFVCHNPARLPSPAAWTNIKRSRVKDSYTNIWWMGTSTEPKADNRRVLTEYSTSMKKLLKTKTYNSGPRPSGFNIGEKSFLKDNSGAIPPNALNLDHNDIHALNFLEIANTQSTSSYHDYCKLHGLELHPARMNPILAEFFIRFLTEEGDLVFDPFAGSNTTGSVAERINRRWIATEAKWEYVAGSRGHFDI